MSINQYYRPSFSEYKSQFVPEKLPFEAMAATLGNRQKSYNEQTALEAQTLGMWDHEALPGNDTVYRDQKKKEIEDWMDKSMAEDKTSPEYVRNYLSFVRGIRDDKNLKIIKSKYATDQEHTANIAKLKENPNTYAYAVALDHDYQQKKKVYTSDPNAGGLGYAGIAENDLGDPNILTGNDKLKEGKEYFNYLKDSGYEIPVSLGDGLYYKNGWHGVSGDDIKDQHATMLNQWVDSPAGRQVGAEFDMQFSPNAPISKTLAKLSDTEKQKYLDDRKSHQAKTLLEIGSGFQHQTTSTNKDDALNKQWQVGQDMIKAAPVQPIMMAPGETGSMTRDYDKDKQVMQSAQDQITNIDHALKVWNNPSLDPVTYDAMVAKGFDANTASNLTNKRTVLFQNLDQMKTIELNASRTALKAMDPKINTQAIAENNEYRGIANDEYFFVADNNVKGSYDQFKGLYGIIKNNAENGVPMNPTIVNQLLTVYEVGVGSIEAVRAKGGLSKEESNKLNEAEQFFRINSSNIFSKIPEGFSQGVKQPDVRDEHGVVQKGAITYNVRPFTGKETYDKAIRESYKDNGSWSPSAITSQMGPVVSTDPRTGAKTTSESADHYVQGIINKKPNDHTFMVGDQIQNDKIIPGSVEIASVNLSNQHGSSIPIFNASWKVQVPDPFNLGKTKEKVVNGTITTNGIGAGEYARLKTYQLRSERQNKPNDPMNLTRMSAELQLSDPKLAQDFTNIARLKAGEEANLYHDNNHLKVIKNSDNLNTYTIKLVDATGKENPVASELSVDGVTNEYLHTIEALKQ